MCAPVCAAQPVEKEGDPLTYGAMPDHYMDSWLLSLQQYMLSKECVTEYAPLVAAQAEQAEH